MDRLGLYLNGKFNLEVAWARPIFPMIISLYVDYFLHGYQPVGIICCVFRMTIVTLALLSLHRTHFSLQMFKVLGGLVLFRIGPPLLLRLFLLLIKLGQ